MTSTAQTTHPQIAPPHAVANSTQFEQRSSDVPHAKFRMPSPGAFA